MITIIADPHAYKGNLPDALRAAAPADYVTARMAIRHALNVGQPLTVHVTDRLLLHWFEDLVDYHDIHWEVIAPEADYRRVFGNDPAPPFTADLLVALDIASISAPPIGAPVEPVGWVLGERLHGLWATAQPGPSHLAQLLAWAMKHADGTTPNLHPLMQHCLTIWSTRDPAYGSLRAGSLLADATQIIRRAALQRYDLPWLREQGLINLPVVALPSMPAEIWIEVVRGLTASIERYWRERIAQQNLDKAFIQWMAAAMSGWSDPELRAITTILSRNPDLLDPSLMQTLRQRFEQLPQSVATLDDLEVLLPPQRPEQPQDDWSDQEWLRWATNDYMPYFAWIVRSQQPREHLEICSLAYETWLARRYPNWLTHAGSPLITGQFTLLRELLNKEPSAVVVWLVVDGLAWWQGRILRESCRRYGLHPQRYEAGVAMLPSLTNISKRALVTGMAVTEPPRSSIAQMTREKLDRIGLRNHVSYDERTILEALQEAEPPQSLIWFANVLDRLAHERQIFANDSMVRGYLDSLGQTLGRMREICFERGRPFHVLIGSDHGSTLLPPNAPTRRLPQATREVVDVWEDTGDQLNASPASARAAVVSDSEQLQLDHPDHWHYLPRLQYQLPQDYLIPRGYAAVGRRATGWTHGGLTPEETIVPLMHLAPERLIIQDLRITLSGQVRSRQAASLTLVISNPNPAPLDDGLIQIADLTPVTVERIAAGGRFEAVVHFPARLIEGTELSLAWKLAGTVLGVNYQQQGDVRIPVRRLQTEDRFDDLFG